MGTGFGDTAPQLCLTLWSCPTHITDTGGSLAVPMVAGAVVLSRGTARASIRAEAMDFVLILAFLLGLAQVGGTQGNLTEMTCEARGAEAKEGSWEIKAAGSRGAWATQTLIHLHLTARAFKAWKTLAMEGSRLVLALPTIGTGRASALVDVLLTPGASESRQADAQEAVEQVLAVSLVQARSRGTLVDLYLTEPPF